jgi:hypothetical protein
MWLALSGQHTTLEELIRVLPAATIAEFRQRVAPPANAASA